MPISVHQFGRRRPRARSPEVISYESVPCPNAESARSRNLLTWVPMAACLACLFLAPPARAQCTSNASSCVQCHEVRGVHPVLQSKAPWHVHHGFGDLCVACHSGNPHAVGEEQAHAGIRQPMADPPVVCAECHEDAVARARRYVVAATETRNASPESPLDRPARPLATPSSPTANRILVGASIVLAAALYLVVRRRKSAGRRQPHDGDWFHKKTWNPYAAGILLGITVAISEVIGGRPLAVSGAFDKLAAYPGRLLFPGSQYYRYVMSPEITWQVWMLLGLLAGSFGASKLSGQARARWLPDVQWETRFGSSRLQRLLVAFFGAVLVQFGAGIAGGCTSGLAISGGAALAPAAFLFMAGMFGGGIPTAWLWYRKGSAR